MSKGNPKIAEYGKATRFPHNDPTKGGRPPSIRRKLKELMEADGDVLIPAKQVKEIKEDGSVVLKLPTQMQLAMKLSSWAMSTRSGSNSLKAIQMIMEQIDGKPKQTIDIKNSTEQLSEEEIEQELKRIEDAERAIERAKASKTKATKGKEEDKGKE